MAVYILGYATVTPITTLQTRNRAGLAYLTLFKAMELVFEALPQSVLQTYVGVSYGQMDPGSDNFKPILVFSVATSMAYSIACLIAGGVALPPNSSLVGPMS
jgi:hypothetical protein